MKTHAWVLVAATSLLAGCSSCTEKPAPECTGTAECKTGEDCVDEKCVPATTVACTNDMDCGIGKGCTAGVCVPRTNTRDAGVVRFDGGGGSSSSGGSEGLGTIQVNPADVVDFGSPVVGMPIAKNVLVKNVGAGPMWANSAAVTGGTSAEFVVTTSVELPRLLQVGEEFRVTITYTLADGEADVGSITVTSDASACSFLCTDPTNVRVALFSEFKGIRNLDLTPGLHDFGFVQAGQMSAYFSLTAKNEGTQTKLLTVQSVTLTGTAGDLAQFEIDPMVHVPGFLSPLETLAIPVRYRPTVEGSHTVDVVVTANSDNPAKRELHATLNGTSLPTGDITADPVDFGHVMLNQTLEKGSVVHNNSNVEVTLTGASFQFGPTAQNFIIPLPSPFPLTIAAGNTAPLTFRFMPQGNPGARGDRLNMDTSLNATTVPVVLTGYADPLPPPPGGPDLSITMAFTRLDAVDNGCNASSLYNWQNMDLILEGGGGTCEKAASQSEANARCSGTDNQCMCSFGTLGGGIWRASGGNAPEPYTTETITHNQSGADGTFQVKNRYAEDCASDWDDRSAAIIQAICGYGGVPPMRYICLPYSGYPYLYVGCDQTGAPYYGHCISETSCLVAAEAIAGSQCNARAPSKAKTVITIRSTQGALVEQRAFCRTFQGASTSKETVVNLIREGGNFRIGTLAAGTSEIGVGASCP